MEIAGKVCRRSEMRGGESLPGRTSACAMSLSLRTDVHADIHYNLDEHEVWAWKAAVPSPT